MMTLKWTGMDTVLRNLKKVDDKLSAAAARGLKKAGMHVLREAQKIVPVQTGNLKGSTFIRNVGTKHHPDIVIGYTAKYAAYVHEDMEKLHGRAFNTEYAEEIAAARLRSKKTGRQNPYYFNRGENQQAKFLEKPARSERNTALRIVGAEMGKV